ADDQLALRNVLAGRAVGQQRRGRLVDVLGDRQVLEVGLARTAATAVVERAAVRHTPAPGQDVDLFLVDLVDRLALDAFQLQKHIYSHVYLLFLCSTCLEKFPVSPPSAMAASRPGSMKCSRLPAGSAGAGGTWPRNTRDCLRSR